MDATRVQHILNNPVILRRGPRNARREKIGDHKRTCRRKRRHLMHTVTSNSQHNARSLLCARVLFRYAIFLGLFRPLSALRLRQQRLGFSGNKSLFSVRPLEYRSVDRHRWIPPASLLRRLYRESRGGQVISNGSNNRSSQQLLGTSWFSLEAAQTAFLISCDRARQRSAALGMCPNVLYGSAVADYEPMSWIAWARKKGLRKSSTREKTPVSLSAVLDSIESIGKASDAASITSHLDGMAKGLLERLLGGKRRRTSSAAIRHSATSSDSRNNKQSHRSPHRVEVVATRKTQRPASHHHHRSQNQHQHHHHHGGQGHKTVRATRAKEPLRVCNGGYFKEPGQSCGEKPSRRKHELVVTTLRQVRIRAKESCNFPRPQNKARPRPRRMRLSRTFSDFPLRARPRISSLILQRQDSAEALNAGFSSGRQ